jgi:hypothetical protein
MFKHFLLYAAMVSLLGACDTHPHQSAVTPGKPAPETAQSGQPAATAYRPTPGKMNGLTFVSPPDPFLNDPMVAVLDAGASWIAVVPYSFTPPGKPVVKFAGDQWWGESPAGARDIIARAHKAGIKVMLKPQVWCRGQWTGNLDFASPEEWSLWEQDYRKYILTYAAIAAETNADLLCIGTEFRVSIEKRAHFWHDLIAEIKKTYKGKLTYSSNWDDWDKVPFWAELDYVGLGGYFPLVEGDTPDVEALRTAWKPIHARLKAFSEQQKKSILFTEFGYLSVDGAGWRNWELESGIKGRKINQLAQSNCYEALFSTFQHEKWWAGGFLWKWFPNMQGHEGYPERDYTPQGKTGLTTIQKWYKKE